MDSFVHTPFDILARDRLKNLLIRDQTAPNDRERLALFYLLSGNIELFLKVDYIYNFYDHSIRPDCLSSDLVDFSSDNRKLILLGFNLFDGHNSVNISDIFYLLDHVNFDLAIESIKIRFGRGGDLFV